MNRKISKQTKNKLDVSIIIVHYLADKPFFTCLKSIYKNAGLCKFEIIVVDNDDIKTIKKRLLKEYPKVIYLPTDKNIGFGAGNNLGYKMSSGKQLLFLNPDTQLQDNLVDRLSNYLSMHPDVGIVAPLLIDKNQIVYPLQGTRKLTPLRAIFSLSIFAKIIPNNRYYREYYITDWDKKSDRQVEVVPGTAFMINKNLFKKINGFDENIFLFFEEMDLCRRICEYGYKLYITPTSRLIHLWGESTKLKKNTQEIFRQSRFYYFKKYYGQFVAILLDSVLETTKLQLILILLVLVGICAYIIK